MEQNVGCRCARGTSRRELPPRKNNDKKINTARRAGREHRQEENSPQNLNLGFHYFSRLKGQNVGLSS